jgi:hypothetical protein
VGKNLKVKDIFPSIPKKIDVNKTHFHIFGKINENEGLVKLDLDMPLTIIKEKQLIIKKKVFEDQPPF